MVRSITEQTKLLRTTGRSFMAAHRSKHDDATEVVKVIGLAQMLATVDFCLVNRPQQQHATSFIAT